MATEHFRTASGDAKIGGLAGRKTDKVIPKTACNPISFGMIDLEKETGGVYSPNRILIVAPSGLFNHMYQRLFQCVK